MKVSYYKNKTTVIPTENKDILYYLARIKEGANSKLIYKIRLTTDKTNKATLKGKLSGVTFAGVFTSRNNSSLKKSSGFAILDFDKHKDVNILKEYFTKDKYVYSVWISPSGNGVKVLVKIPMVSNNDDYSSFAKSLYKYFKQVDEYADTGTTDVSRLCFESYDPEIYINENSIVYTDFIEEKPLEVISQTKITVPLTDKNAIADKLMVWFRKRFFGKDRNTNLHSLARQFNAFGVDKNTCLSYLLPYQQSDFKEKEIKQLINSAYKYTSDHNTQKFEDRKNEKKLIKLIKRGKQKDYIKKELNIEESIIESIQKETDVYPFWEYTEKGSVDIRLYRFKEFLKDNNIFKVFTTDDADGYSFIKKEGFFIDYIQRAQIKEFVMTYLDKNHYEDVFDSIGLKPQFFSKEGLSVVNTADFDIEKDTKDTAIIYYKNKAVKVYKDKFELLDYKDLKGYVWKNRVIDRDINLTDESNGEFKRFVWLISGEEAERYYTMKSVIGYLLHSYKDRVNTRAIILNDEMISDVPNGGSGKGLLNNAIGYVKKMGIVNGKDYKHDNQFKFQDISPDAQFVHFDDVTKGFNFENLFNIITGDFKIEKKGKDPIVLDFEKSPKITISTNYTIKGDGGSFNRRVFEVELSSFFNDSYSPRDEFKHDLFDEWDSQEWEKFDNYMLRALQYYLNNGLVKSNTKNLDVRKLINDTNKDFVDFMDNADVKNKRYYKAELKDEFVNDFDDFKSYKWFTANLFNRWLKKYCDFKKYTLEKGKANGQRYVKIITLEEEENPLLIEQELKSDYPF